MGKKPVRSRQRRGTAAWLGLFILLAAAGLSAAPEAPKPPPPGPAAPAPAPSRGPSTRIGQAVRLQRGAKNRLLEIIQTMHQVSAQIEKTDPQTARALATAAQKAEEAFVADDMDKVIKLLDGGLDIPAHAAQTEVVRKLRQVLEALRGGIDDLNARILELQRLLQMMEAMRELLRRQRVLERQSRALAFGAETEASLAEAVRETQAAEEAQRDVLNRTRALVVDPIGRRLAQASLSLLAVRGRIEALVRSLGDKFPPPDAMAGFLTTSKSLSAETSTARVALRTLFNEGPVAQALAAAKATDASSAADAALGKAVDELGRAAKSLQADDLEKACVAAAEARAHVDDALSAMDRSGAALPAARPQFEIHHRQKALAERLDALESRVEAAAPTRAVSDDAIPGPAAALVRPNPNVPRPAAGAVPLKPRAGDAARAAAEAIRRCDLDAAGEDQGRSLDALRRWSAHLGATARSIADLRKDPQYPRQQAEQQAIAAAIALLAAGAVPGATAADSRPAATQPLPNEIQASVAQAARHAGTAADHLGQTKPAEANREQNEVIKLLEEAASKLQSYCESIAPGLVDELQDNWIATLERIVAAQKRCCADTIELWGKRLPDGTYRRPDQLAFATLARDQGWIVTGLDEMEKLMSTAMASHALVTWPPVVQMMMGLVREEVPRVQKRLAALDAGPPTQRTQRDILEWLDCMLKAMTPSNNNMTPPPRWGDNGFGDVDVGSTDITAEIQMLIALQRQINRHTEELDQQRAGGASLDPGSEAELRKLAGQEREVARMVRNLFLGGMDRWRPGGK
jgi:hypothetical protein